MKEQKRIPLLAALLFAEGSFVPALRSLPDGGTAWLAYAACAVLIGITAYLFIDAIVTKQCAHKQQLDEERNRFTSELHEIQANVAANTPIVVSN